LGETRLGREARIKLALASRISLSSWKPKMRAHTAVSFLCWLFAWQGLAGVQESTLVQGTATYRVDVRLVQVDAQVINKKTHQVAGSLRQNDLQVYEDGVQQQTSTFSQDELPLSVVLLVDLTDTVRPVLQALSQGAQQALQHLKPQDEVAVLVYSASIHLLQDFTIDRSLAAAAVDKAAHLRSPEAAFFNEAVFKAATYLSAAKNPDSRRVILWFTDNVANTPTPEMKAHAGRSLSGKELHTEKQALEQLFRTGTVVCTLLKKSLISDRHEMVYRAEMSPDRRLYPPGDVHSYAEATGGLVVESSDKTVPAKLAELIDDVRLRYTIGYRPSVVKPPGTFCNIKVELAPEIKKLQKDLVVKARQGYYR
jgi:VWFA-related protein